jgi:hypothetical protein
LSDSVIRLLAGGVAYECDSVQSAIAVDDEMCVQCPYNHHAVRSAYHPPASSTFLSERTSHQQPAATSQQYSSLRRNQHQPSATSQPNRLVTPQPDLNTISCHRRGVPNRRVTTHKSLPVRVGQVANRTVAHTTSRAYKSCRQWASVCAVHCFSLQVSEW